MLMHLGVSVQAWRPRNAGAEARDVKAEARGQKLRDPRSQGLDLSLTINRWENPILFLITFSISINKYLSLNLKKF